MPAGAIMDTMELSNHPDLRARGQFETAVDPYQGEYEMVGCPIKLSESNVPLQPAPHLGEHNKQIYCDLLGISDRRV